MKVIKAMEVKSFWTEADWFKWQNSGFPLNMSITSLSIRNTNLKTINSKIKNLPNIRYLRIQGNNKLTKVPFQIGTLKNLKELIITDNENLKMIPDFFVSLKNLDILNLSNNKLHSLPYHFYNFTVNKIDTGTHIHQLFLNNNRFEFTINYNQYSKYSRMIDEINLNTSINRKTRITISFYCLMLKLPEELIYLIFDCLYYGIGAVRKEKKDHNVVINNCMLLVNNK